MYRTNTDTDTGGSRKLTAQIKKEKVMRKHNTDGSIESLRYQLRRDKEGGKWGQALHNSEQMEIKIY